MREDERRLAVWLSSNDAAPHITVIVPIRFSLPNDLVFQFWEVDCFFFFFFLNRFVFIPFIYLNTCIHTEAGSNQMMANVFSTVHKHHTTMDLVSYVSITQMMKNEKRLFKFVFSSLSPFISFSSSRSYVMFLLPFVSNRSVGAFWLWVCDN